MAVKTCHIITRVNRTREVPLLRIVAVTGQAIPIDLLFGKSCEADDLTDVAAAFHMFRARPMTRLATVTALKRRCEVRCRFKILLVQVLVAGFADVHPNVLSRGFAWDGSATLLSLSCKWQGNNAHQQRYEEWRRNMGTPSR